MNKGKTPNDSAQFAQSEQRKIIEEIVKTRQAHGVSQHKLSEESGVKQPIIARMEKHATNPQMETVLKVLYPLNKTLSVVSADFAKGGDE